jgi:hypothetical protein
MGYSSSGIKQHDYSAFEQNAVDGAPDRRVGIKSSVPLSLGVESGYVIAPAEIAASAVNFATNVSEEFLLRDVMVSITATDTGAHTLTGSHTGLGNSATMTDATKGWVTNSLVGAVIFNDTDASSGTILSNTGNTITATLAGGADNDWDLADAYHINGVSFLNVPGATWPINGLVGRTVLNTTDGSSGMITSNTGTKAVATLTGGVANVWDLGNAYSIASAPLAPSTPAEILVLLDSCRGPAFDAILERFDPSVSAATSVWIPVSVVAEGVHLGHGLVPSTHTGASGVPALADSTASFPPGGLVGLTVLNVTDGSSGLITANTATAVTATLSGGVDNDWDLGDQYMIDGQDQIRVVYANPDLRTIGLRFSVIVS